RAGRHEAVGVDRGHGALVGLEGRQVGHVRGRAVRVTGGDEELLPRAGGEDALGRLHGNPFDAGVAGGRARRGGGEPAAQRVVPRRAGGEAPAAAVRRLGGGLAQQQAALGRRRQEAPAAPFVEDRVVIEVGVVAEQ